NSPITDVTDPTDPQDAATKAYVDNINVTNGTGISVSNPSPQNFQVAVTNPVIAIGRITGGTDSSIGATVTNNSGGSYTVDLTISPAPSDYTVQLTTNSSSGPRTIQVTNHAATQFSVQIYDGSTGLTSDSDWYFTVISF
uniref:hypothetical protein n=1 Tax=Allomuricauda sp. M10 TaxID=2683292 RepID=UPI001D191AC0